MSLREIIRPPRPDNRSRGEPCPHCGQATRAQVIRCPDNMDGCLVLHYGWHCDGCGRDYEGGAVTVATEQGEQR